MFNISNMPTLKNVFEHIWKKAIRSTSINTIKFQFQTIDSFISHGHEKFANNSPFQQEIELPKLPWFKASTNKHFHLHFITPLFFYDSPIGFPPRSDIDGV